MQAVIPTTGRPSLAAAVKSVMRQTIPVHPIIVLDRPEKADDVRSVLDPFDHTLVITEGATGGAAARNLGIEHSEADYICFLDDDDTWLPHKTETQLEACSKVQSPFLLSASAMVFDRSFDHVVIPRRPPETQDGIGSYMVQRPELRFGSNVVQSSTLLMSKLLVQRCTWNANLRKHQDWDYVTRCLSFEDVNFVWVNEPLAIVTKGSQESISMTCDWRASAEFLRDHRNELSRKAAADFVWSQIIRASLQKGDFAGVRFALSQRELMRPHWTAAVVGLSGAAERLKQNYRASRKRSC
ncbi:glycosyltransferase family A protein [Mycobacterium sp. IS-1742]|uniref:glycosyltransferase family A protein n=1 Tax=Mycobacterium sp. IS-1742 TaxID=1772285 RepID=UPI00336C04B3